jgi:23S rRNA pseudouridine1911/1915/1917 synthase
MHWLAVEWFVPETVASQAQYPIEFRVSSEDIAKRLDQFLVANIPDVSRARIQQVIEQGNVLVNGTPGKPSYKLRAGDSVSVIGPAERAPLRAIAEEIPLDIVYEDEDLAVVNKPAGMMVHAGAGATDDERNRGTLVNALLHRFAALSNIGGELRPGIVHRLDRETSGLIVVAKNDIAHRKLAEQFSSRLVKKRYLALVHGWPKQDAGTINTAISRDAIRRTRMTTRRTGGREAVSHWHVLRRIDSYYGKFALVEVKIDTGRTHQIRVHMSSIGHPVVGDTLYGAPKEIPKGSEASRKGASAAPRKVLREAVNNIPDTVSLPRNFLHAAAIEFQHPGTGALLSFSRGLPPELDEFIVRISR